MEGLGVLVGRRRRRVVVGHRLHDQHYKADEEADAENGADRPEEVLAADDHATEVDVALLRLAGISGAGKEPALLGLIQRPRQRRPVQVLQVPAPVIVCRRLIRNLQRATPWISSKHFSSSSSFFSPSNINNGNGFLS